MHLHFYFFKQQEKKARFATLNGVVDQTKGVACYGSSSLLQLLGDYANATGREGSLKVGLVGKEITTLTITQT